MTVAIVHEDLPNLFPYFGGKRKVAATVWERLGSVSNYVEPFAGSLAVLLRRPEEHQWWERIETVNDADCLIANFWRALAAEPSQLAHLASWPVNEADLTSRHLHLVQHRDELATALMSDPEFYDLKSAAWWVWGICAYVGADWCTGTGGFTGSSEDGPGVFKKMPMTSGMHGGKGIHRPRAVTADKDLTQSTLEAIMVDFNKVANRLRRVRVVCGNWDRVLKQTAQPQAGHVTGVFLDPPYDPAERRKDLYAVESDGAEPVHALARQWALENGEDKTKRIIYCGYSTDAEDSIFLEAGWEPIRWKASGGYGLAGDNRARSNAKREVLWCSPTCIQPNLMLPF